MDKAGHVYTTYQLGRLMMGAFDWAGYSRRQKLFIGGTLGFAYMTAIEMMDGYSRGWGFSWGDEVADILGTSLVIGQEAFWKEQRIQLKFSFAKSGLAKYNPNLLGDSFSTQLLKDYNGQTYWLSVNPSSFIKKENKFPRWLNIALGYSAYGMLGGHENKIIAQDDKGNVLAVERHRRFYVSLDVDLTRINVKQKWLKKVFSVISLVKFPAPALEWNRKRFRAYAIYN